MGLVTLSVDHQTLDRRRAVGPDRHDGLDLLLAHAGFKRAARPFRHEIAFDAVANRRFFARQLKASVNL